MSLLASSLAESSAYGQSERHCSGRRSYRPCLDPQLLRISQVTAVYLRHEVLVNITVHTTLQAQMFPAIGAEENSYHLERATRMPEITGEDDGDNPKAIKVKISYSSQPTVLMAAGIQLFAIVLTGQPRDDSGVAQG